MNVKEAIELAKQDFKYKQGRMSNDIKRRVAYYIVSVAEA